MTIHKLNAATNHTSVPSSVESIARSLNFISSSVTSRPYTRNAIAPAIIDRHSTLAYAFPFCAITSPSVASATEGAAPHNPAKLVGFSMLPSSANAETTAPPIRNRIRISIGAAETSRFLDRFMTILFQQTAELTRTGNSKIISAMKWMALLTLAAASISNAQTMDMNEVSKALGVRCDYCHARGAGQTEPPPEPKKQIALAMMAMTRDLNTKIQEATGKPPSQVTRVDCATCHRGVPIPQPISTVLLRTIAAQGGAAAADQYRDLRKQFFSRDAYDFSENALLEVAERVAQGRPDDAIALLRMNLEYNPRSAKTYALLGFAYTRKLDDASAIANLQKSLELDPTDAMVRGRLEQLQEYQRRNRPQ